MAEAERHLHPVEPGVDQGTGEIRETCENCASLSVQLAGAERDIRSWRARYNALYRDKEAEAKEHRLWPRAIELFNHWREVCNHPRSKWTADRFWECESLLKDYGFDLCKRAIDGAAFDPFTKRRKNGSTIRFDGWDLIFRNAGKLEEFANRAPRAERPTESEGAACSTPDASAPPSAGLNDPLPTLSHDESRETS